MNDMELIDYCMEHSDELTNWEADFVDSIQNQLYDDMDLSDRQFERLNEIYERLTG